MLFEEAIRTSVQIMESFSQCSLAILCWKKKILSGPARLGSSILGIVSIDASQDSLMDLLLACKKEKRWFTERQWWRDGD